MTLKTWQMLLEAARGVPEGKLTSAALVDAAGIPPTKRSSAVDVAGAWLHKLFLWGYVTHDGKFPRVYRLTRYGKEVKFRQPKAVCKRCGVPCARCAKR